MGSPKWRGVLNNTRQLSIPSNCHFDCILSHFTSKMTRITRSVTALARSLNSKPPMQKKPWKLTKGQRGQVTKRIDAIGKLREAKILQNIAVNKLGVGQILRGHQRKERIKKKTFSKKKENVRERNAKKASLGVENVKQELRGLSGTKEESGQMYVK